MPLEPAGDNLNALDPLNPTTTDGVNQGDDHLRNFKQTVKDSFGDNPSTGRFTSVEFQFDQGLILPNAATAEFNTPITRNGGVAQGAVRINGSTATPVTGGGQFGFTNWRRTAGTSVGDGDYEIFIPTTTGIIPEQATFSLDVFYGFSFGVGTIGENFSASGNGWWRVITGALDLSGNITKSDCVSFGVTAFNANGFS